MTAEFTALMGEGTSVAAYCDGAVTIVAKCDPSNPFRVVQDIGAVRPVHATAVGKAIVAFLPPADRAAIVAQLQFERYTPRTLTTRAVFEGELRRIRSAGYAIDDEEHNEGIRCIAAPIFAHTGCPVASLCVVGPRIRMTRQRLRDLRAPLLASAKLLSTMLDWTDDPTVAPRPA